MPTKLPRMCSHCHRTHEDKPEHSIVVTHADGIKTYHHTKLYALLETGAAKEIKELAKKPSNYYGPAIEYPDGSVEYWIAGVKVSKEIFELLKG